MPVRTAANNARASSAIDQLAVMRFLSFTLGLACACFLAACRPGSPPPHAVDPSQAKPVAQKRIPLHELIPAPGLVFAVELRPRQLWENTALRQDWRRVFKGERIAAFERASGLKLKQVEDLWIAGYPLGTLLLLDAAQNGMMVERAFTERSSSIESTEFKDENAQLLVGLVDGVPQALFHRKGDFIAIAEGDIGLVRIVQAYAAGRLKATSALKTRFVAPLSEIEPYAPLRAVLVGPFPGATDAVSQSFASGLATVTPVFDQLEVQLVGRGLWPENSASALSSWMTQVLDTREMRAVGLGFPQHAPVVNCQAESDAESAGMPLNRCRTQVRYDSAQLAENVYRLTQAPLNELLGEETLPGWRSRLLRPADTKAGQKTKDETTPESP